MDLLVGGPLFVIGMLGFLVRRHMIVVFLFRGNDDAGDFAQLDRLGSLPR